MHACMQCINIIIDFFLITILIMCRDGNSKQMACVVLTDSKCLVNLSRARVFHLLLLYAACSDFLGRCEPYN